MSDITFKNTSGATLYLEEYNQQKLADTEQVSFPEDRVRRTPHPLLDALIAAGDITVINDKAQSCPPGPGQRIVDGVPDAIMEGGSTGQVWCTPSNGIPAWVDPAPLEFNYAEDDLETNTTSATYVERLKLTTPSIPAGDYLIDWQLEMIGTDENANYCFRVQVDDLTDIIDTCIAPKKKYSDGVFLPLSGFKKVTLTAAVHTVDIDYKALEGKVHYMRNVRLKLQRVG